MERYMKKIVLTLLVCLVAGFSAQGFAQDATRVCVAQIATILPNSPQVQAATEALKAKFSQQQDDIKALQENVANQQKDLQKNAPTMSEDEQVAAQAQLEADNQDLVTKIAAFQQAVSEEQTTQMKTVFDELNEVIENYATANNCSAVLDSQFVVWSDPANDVTADIQKAFDAAGSK